MMKLVLLQRFPALSLMRVGMMFCFATERYLSRTCSLQLVFWANIYVALPRPRYAVSCRNFNALSWSSMLNLAIFFCIFSRATLKVTCASGSDVAVARRSLGVLS